MKNITSKIYCFFILVFFSLAANCQLIDHTETFRNISSDKYFRFHYDNDFFTATDQYYTQGITVELVTPTLKKFFLSKLLWRPYNSDAGYGIALNLFGYTPTSLQSDEILYGDRPFESNISFKTFSIQADEIHHQQLSSAFSIGVMGKAALGYDIQYNLHKLLGNKLPHGWQYQVKNDVIINYQVNYEKQLVSIANNFLLNAAAEARAGTLNDKINGGINFMAGRFNKRFVAENKETHKAEYYFFGQGRINVIGYDATLQGGMFDRQSPYIIPASAITRLTFQADAGIVVNFKKLYLSYTQSFLTKEFQAGITHRWGGISVGFAL